MTGIVPAPSKMTLTSTIISVVDSIESLCGDLTVKASEKAIAPRKPNNQS